MKATNAYKLAAAASACALVMGIVGCTPNSNGGADTGATTETTTTATGSDEKTETGTSTDTTTTTDATGTATESAQLTAQTAVEQGYQVFEGTIHVCSAEELLALQGRTDLDPAIVSGGGTYAVLALDQEIEVSGMGADGSGERVQSANMLGIAEYTAYDSLVVEYGNLESWRSLDGQHVALAARAQDIWFPSDVRLPIGQPTAYSVVVLG